MFYETCQMSLYTYARYYHYIRKIADLQFITLYNIAHVRMLGVYSLAYVTPDSQVDPFYGMYLKCLCYEF